MDRLSAELNVLVRIDLPGLRKLKIPRALKALNQKLVGKGSVLKMLVDLPAGRLPGPRLCPLLKYAQTYYLRSPVQPGPPLGAVF